MKPSVSEAHQFLEKCFLGDQHALEDFVRRFSPLIYRTVHYTFTSKQVQFTQQDLEDLHHTVFLHLFDKQCKKLKQYKGLNGCSLSSWIRIVAVRIVLNSIKKAGFESIGRQKQRLPFDEWAEINEGATETKRLMVTADLEESLQKMIETLSPRDRLFMSLHYSKGYPIKDVAYAMGLSMENAYTLKHRIIGRLKASMSKFE
jgi:RNA polymerase sigma factor (sigma-70 family)